MILAPSPTLNEKNGNGKYKPLRRRKKQTSEEKKDEFKYLTVNDPRMRFNNSRDPIYYAFECLERRTVPQLMSDFVHDSFFEIAQFVSKVMK